MSLLSQNISLRGIITLLQDLSGPLDMPSFDITIEDNSPILKYSQNWMPGSSVNDSLADMYSQSSFTVTKAQGETMSFDFNGTKIQIFGSRRPNHGQYTVSVDGPVVSSAVGNQGTANIFQSPLYDSGSSFSYGHHSVVLTNQDTNFLDVDYVTWTTKVGEDDEALIVTTIQDTDPSFVYSPVSVWNVNPKNVGLFLGSSGHATASPGASTTLTFTGDAISLYGPVAPDGAAYSVQLDGGQPKNYTSKGYTFRPQLMLYHASHLGPGSHAIQLQHQSFGSQSMYLAIDYAAIYTTTTITATPTGQSMNGASHHKLSKGTIAGIVTGIVGGILLLAGVVFWFMKRKGYIACSKGNSGQEIGGAVRPFILPQQMQQDSSSPTTYGSPTFIHSPVHQSPDSGHTRTLTSTPSVVRSVHKRAMRGPSIGTNMMNGGPGGTQEHFDTLSQRMGPTVRDLEMGSRENGRLEGGQGSVVPPPVYTQEPENA